MKFKMVTVDEMRRRCGFDASHASFGLEGGESPLNTLFTYRNGKQMYIRDETKSL